METDNLINLLAADAGKRRPPMSRVWQLATIVSVVIAGAVFFATLGFRPDIAQAVQTPRFLFKFVVTLSLVGGALLVARALSRPGANWRAALPGLAISPALLATAVVVELFVLPPDRWAIYTIGTNSMICLTYIPLIGAGPLAVFLAVMRYGAPPRPGVAGAVAGLLAGAIAATFYAAQCTDDSPLFVATWYTLAIAILTVAGAVLGTRVARW